MRWSMLPVSIGAHMLLAAAIVIVPLAAQRRVAPARGVAIARARHEGRACSGVHGPARRPSYGTGG